MIGILVGAILLKSSETCPINRLLQLNIKFLYLASGIARGLVGAVTKPLGGAAEFVAQTGAGLLSGAGWTVAQTPKAPPTPMHTQDYSAHPLKYAYKVTIKK